MTSLSPPLAIKGSAWNRPVNRYISSSNYTSVTDRYYVLFVNLIPRHKKSGRVPRYLRESHGNANLYLTFQTLNHFFFFKGYESKWLMGEGILSGLLIIQMPYYSSVFIFLKHTLAYLQFFILFFIYCFFSWKCTTMHKKLVWFFNWFEQKRQKGWMKIYIHSPTADGAKGTAEIEPRNFPQDSQFSSKIHSYNSFIFWFIPFHE